MMRCRRSEASPAKNKNLSRRADYGSRTAKIKNNI